MVWCCVHESCVRLTQEYNCGGTMPKGTIYFKKVIWVVLWELIAKLSNGRRVK